MTGEKLADKSDGEKPLSEGDTFWEDRCDRGLDTGFGCDGGGGAEKEAGKKCWLRLWFRLRFEVTELCWGEIVLGDGCWGRGGRFGRPNDCGEDEKDEKGEEDVEVEEEGCAMAAAF